MYFKWLLKLVFEKIYKTKNDQLCFGLKFPSQIHANSPLHFSFSPISFRPVLFLFPCQSPSPAQQSNVRLMAEIGSDSDKERVNIILRSCSPGLTEHGNNKQAKETSGSLG